VAIFLMLVGIGLIGVLTATVASYFVGQNEHKAMAELDQVFQQLETAKDERDHLAAKLDRLSAQMDELLNRSTPAVRFGSSLNDLDATASAP
jgi:voltage-gated potassium channel